MRRKDLLGKTREEIAQKLGYGYNIYDNDIWIYQIGKTWIGRRIILTITFNNGKVSEVSIVKTFRKTL
ncbi:hypothetical protein [Chryseobacterium sp.]|uniref:hypothetical protein n=1 Tax=Chryseobacterium sp. TaxID=1871047 RepID=UPI0031E20285